MPAKVDTGFHLGLFFYGGHKELPKCNHEFCSEVRRCVQACRQRYKANTVHSDPARILSQGDSH